MRPTTALGEHERVELAEAMVAALNARELTAYFALTTPDFVIRTDPGWEGGGVVAGRIAVEAFYRNLFANWEDLHYERLEAPVVIADRVFAKDRWRGYYRQRRSTIGLYYAVTTFRDHRATAIDTFTDRDEATAFARTGRRRSRVAGSATA